MKLLAGVFSVGLFLCGTSVFGAPMYRAGENSSSARSLLHGEISGGYVFSSNRVAYVTEEDSSSRLQGVEVRALWSPLSWLSVGAEMDRLGDEKLSPMIKAYRVNRQTGLIKLTLTPNTTPRFYLIGGYGKSEHKLTYEDFYFGTRNKRPAITKDLHYWTVGLGVEADVWKCLFVGIEGNWVRYNDNQLSAIFKMSSRVETDVRVRVGLRF